MPINGRTCVTAVLGHPIEHTASPAMHNAGFQSLKLNWCYLALKVEIENLRETLLGLGFAGLAGVNLTVPHKIHVMKWLNEVDATARHLGAANTIQFSRKKGRLQMKGYNTDGYGLLMALKQVFHFHPRGKRIAVVGCGGAGRGAAIQMALSGAKKLVLMNRTKEKAIQVARRVRGLGCKTQCVYQPEPCDLIIQATTLGMKKEDEMPISKEAFEVLSPQFLYDMIYRPFQTPMMKKSAQSGVQVANGLEMLLYQGARAFEIWTRRKAPIEAMRKALDKEICGS